MSALEVRVLGRPTVWADGHRIALTGRPLTLAVRLAIAGRNGVSASRLERDLWPGEDGSVGAVRVTLTRLRQAIGAAAAITRSDTGYTLNEPDLDMWTFERKVSAGRDRGSSVETRLASYLEALGMWTGPAFDGLDDIGWARGEARRLDELREMAIDERFDLLIDHGHHGQTIADLSDAHVRAPTRERRTALLALALYQSERQTEALAVIAETKRILREDMGLFSGPALDALERKILHHDPVLAVPAIARRSTAASEVDSRIRAATTLCRAAAYDDAAELLDEARQLAEAAGDRRSLGLVHVERARCAMLSGTGDPHALLDQARAIGRELRDGRVLARSALVRAGSGVPPEGSAAMLELMEPIELLPAGDPDAIHLFCFAAVAVTVLDSSSAAIHLIDEAERLCAVAASPASEVVLGVARSLCGGLRGDPIEISAMVATRSLDDARALDDPLLIAIACLAAVRCHFATGDIVAVERLLPILAGSSNAAMLPFGTIRVHLCETMIALIRGRLDLVPALIEREYFEGVRLATHVVHAATRTHQLLEAYELDDSEEIVTVARVMATAPGAPRTWVAVLAACGDDAAGDDLPSLVRSLRAQDLNDGDLAGFLAFTAEVAYARADAELGQWCAAALGARAPASTLMTGLGTMVLGFVAHFDGLAHIACSDLEGGRARLEHAIEMAHASQAWSWHAHSSIELAHLLTRTGGASDLDRSRALLESVESSRAGARSARLARRAAECRAALDARQASAT